jgi:hypothetical protein
MVHLQSGLRILRDMRMRSGDTDHTLENKIAPLFMRLAMQSIIYVDTRSGPDRKAIAHQLTNVSARETVMLEEARDALNQAADSLFRVFYTCE